MLGGLEQNAGDRAFTDTGGRLIGYCLPCEIRACTSGRSLETCAPCTEYDGCGKLVAFHEHAPEAKATLDGLRAAM